jgi:diaminopimelate decarboxylase
MASELLIGGIRAEELADNFGTPLYVYDGEVVRRQYNLLKKHLPQFEIFYSLKANGSMALARILAQMGSGAEIASRGELVLAQAAGFPSNKIIFAGPGKDLDELESAVEAGILCFNAESSRELKRLEEIGQRKKRKILCTIRLNTCEGAEAPEQMVGGPSKFGWDQERVVLELASLLPKLKQVQVGGIHLYTASGVLDPEALLANAQRTVKLAKEISEELGIQLQVVNFGGGFGVPYFPHEVPLDLEALGKELSELLRAENFTGPRLFFELGRFLVAQSGYFLTKVIDIKESRGQNFAITDGGMNQFLRPVFMNLNHPTVAATKLDLEPDTTYQLGGPCCTPIDFLARDLTLPKLKVGDLIAIGNAGAYGFSMSMLYFLGHPLPAEVLVERGETRLIRQRGKAGDCLVNQIG